MNDLEKTIKHFESLQKRYTTQHNGKMCERVADALEALNFYKETMEKIDRISHALEIHFEEAKTPKFKVTYAKPTLQNFVPKKESDREFLENNGDMEI